MTAHEEQMAAERVMDRLGRTAWTFHNHDSGYGTFRANHLGTHYSITLAAEGIGLFVTQGGDHVKLGRASTLMGARELLAAYFGAETDSILRMLGWIE